MSEKRSGARFLEDLRQTILKHLGAWQWIDQRDAEALAAAVSDELLERTGGRSVYFARLPALMEPRNNDIRTAFAGGATYSELAERFRLSEARIRSITARTRGDGGLYGRGG
jgi:Mor family transcriptional regulator